MVYNSYAPMGSAAQYDVWGDSEAASRGPGVSGWNPYAKPNYGRSRWSNPNVDISIQQQQPQKMTADQQNPIKYQQPQPPNFSYIGGDLRSGPTLMPGQSGYSRYQTDPYTGRPRPPAGGMGIAVGEPYPGMDPVSKPGYGNMGPSIAAGEPMPGQSGYQKPKIGPNTGGQATDPYVPEPGGQRPPTLPPQQPPPQFPQYDPSLINTGWDPYVRMPNLPPLPTPAPTPGGGGTTEYMTTPGTSNNGGWMNNPLNQYQAINAANYWNQMPAPQPLPTPAPVPGGGGGVPDASQSERPQIIDQRAFLNGTGGMNNGGYNGGYGYNGERPLQQNQKPYMSAADIYARTDQFSRQNPQLNMMKMDAPPPQFGGRPVMYNNQNVDVSYAPGYRPQIDLAQAQAYSRGGQTPPPGSYRPPMYSGSYMPQQSYSPGYGNSYGGGMGGK